MANEYDEAVPSREAPASATALPVFGARQMWSRETPSPDRREGLSPGYDPSLNTTPSLGSSGFGNRASTSQEIPVTTKNGFEAQKKNPNLNFCARIFSGGVGVFHVKGWGPKSSVCPSKPRESNLFGGISRDFARISRKRPKSLRKKCLGSILVP